MSFLNTSSSNLEPHLTHLIKFRLNSCIFVHQMGEFRTNNLFNS
jgi:hypothetical protein